MSPPIDPTKYRAARSNAFLPAEAGRTSMVSALTLYILIVGATGLAPRRSPATSQGSELRQSSAPHQGRQLGRHLGGAHSVSGSQSDVRFHGEYGLWVFETEDQIEVRWITGKPASGYLRMLVGDDLHHEARTSSSSFHSAIFPKPPAGQVVLQYGALGDPSDEHETTLYLSHGTRARKFVFDSVDSLFVVGDVHGEYDTLVQLLRNAGLVDVATQWIGGTNHLVLLGDVFDRGPDVTATLWFLYRLERQAESDGGRVHVVLGNHEIMVMMNDLRYVSEKEKLIAEYHGTEYWRMFDTRSSLLGKWLASKSALLKIDDVLLAHGGVSLDYLEYSLEAFDDSLASFMNEDLFHRWVDSTVVVAPIDSAALHRRMDFFFGDKSVFWHRGYVQTDTLAHALKQVLKRFKSDLHVVAHTPVETIEERYGGAVVAVDLHEPATEMLLLVRSGNGYETYRYRLEGPPEPLPPPPPPSRPQTQARADLRSEDRSPPPLCSGRGKFTATPVNRAPSRAPASKASGRTAHRRQRIVIMGRLIQDCGGPIL